MHRIFILFISLCVFASVLFPAPPAWTGEQDMGAAPPRPGVFPLAPIHGGNCSVDNPYWKSITSKDPWAALLRFVEMSRPFGARPATPGQDRELARAVEDQKEGDYTRAWPVLERFADRGNAEAQYRTALLYRFGLGVRANATLAMRAFKAAADQGHWQAMGQLGVMFWKGENGTRDRKRAACLIRTAADHGEADFERTASDMLRYFPQLPEDRTVSTCYLVRSAFHGDPWGMYGLGELLESKARTRKELEEAVAWYWRAAETGLSPAALRIASFYEDGLGLPRNETLARAWHQVAMDNLSPQSMLSLAIKYLRGQGGNRDPYRAAVLCHVLASMKLRWGDGLLQEAEAGLTPDQREQARAEAKEWRPPLPGYSEWKYIVFERE